MSKQTQFKKYKVLGVEVDALAIKEAVDYITKKAANPSSPAGYVVKAYVEFLDSPSDEIKNLLNQAELCLPDGVSLNWAVHYLYGGRRSLRRLISTLTQIALQPPVMLKELPGRFSGINFTWPLLEKCQQMGLRIYLIGSPKKQTIEATAQSIQTKLPGLNLVGYSHGRLKTDDEARLIEDLQADRPDIILVGMGFPRQEQLMARLIRVIDHGVLIGEGGTFDYQQWGGTRPKAPIWLQRIGLEWLWRLVIEPSRFRRQMAIPRFIWSVYKHSRLKS